MENQEQLIKECEKKAQEWLSSPVYDEKTKAEVKKLLDSSDKTPLIEAFYRSLEFGTGGLRGIMGAGTNRMNIYTVGAATQGLSNYLKKSFPGQQIKVCIGYDCRNNSLLFVLTSANIFSANGIKVYIFDEMRPTPEMSFAIRHFHCQSGIILTASHNPKEYNGYKAYWDDGAQVLPPHDKGIIDEVNKVKAEDIKFQGNEELIEFIGKKVDDLYLEKVHTLSIDKEAINHQKDLKIVYTPLHGTGMMLVPKSLKLWGFENVHVVPQQGVKDGNFPTVVSPNPENASAMKLAINLAKKIDADLVMGTDPDADRIALGCKNDKGEWILMNGNQTALIYLYYIIENRLNKGLMKGNEFIVKTIVTTELIKRIAEKNHIEMFDVYTGFKWIAREIQLNEPAKQYIGGGEESFGFLPEDFVRDKDGVSSASLLAEICAWAKDNGKSLYEMLMEMYLKYGFSMNYMINVVRPGKTGAEEIVKMMENYRHNTPKTLGGDKVIAVKDYEALTETDADGSVKPLNMPVKSNVLQYFTEGGCKVSVRPSGTEPKIKFYIEVAGKMECPKCYDGACAETKEKAAKIAKDLGVEL